MADRHQELGFLPAALEIQERPPSPIGRAIIWVIIGLFSTAILWACFGQLDIVAVAHGKVVPQGRSKVIQPAETGIVRAIHVNNGQRVGAGDVLVELDATDAQASLEQITNELRSTNNELLRRRALLQALESGVLDLGVHAETFAVANRELQLQLLQAAFEETTARQDEVRLAIVRAEESGESAREQVLKLEAVLPIITERATSLEKLSAQSLVSRSQYLELRQELIEAEQDLKSQQAARRSALAQVEELTRRRDTLVARERSTILVELDELERKRSSLRNELEKATQANLQRRLIAPVDGVVQQLSVFTIGGVVTPAEQLMVIVPDAQALEVEAMVLNRDIGFVHKDQAAVVKIDAFPFTRYGSVDARIATLSEDAVPVEEIGLAYTANVALAKSSLTVDGREVPLSPGMAVTVEIMTGKRRVIEFLMSPLLRYGAESARER